MKLGGLGKDVGGDADALDAVSDADVARRAFRSNAREVFDLAALTGRESGVSGFDLRSLGIAIVGALLFLWLYRMMKSN